MTYFKNMQRILFLLSVISVALASRYWDQWAAGNGGVHSNPVFKTKPQIRWTFNNNTFADGVLPIDNQEHHIYVANGEVGQPAFWKFSWGGQILASWDSPFQNIFFEGTIGSRNGVVYVYTGGMDTLFAINETTLTQIWNTTGLVSSSNPYSNNPLQWNEDYSILYLSTANQVHAINASSGEKIWSTQPISGQTYYSPLIRSTLDNTFVIKIYNGSLIKYNATNGEVVWFARTDDRVWNTPSPPTVDNTNGSVYAASFTGLIQRLNMNRGYPLWTKQDSSGSFSYHSPVLFNSEWVLISGTTSNTGMTLYSMATGEAVKVFSYDQINGTQFQLFSQPLLNREQNVLYIVLFETAQLVALNTSNMFNFTVMWVLDTPFSQYGGGGPSIASDGTIFLANTVRDYPIGLVSIGCPITKQLSSDGLTCVCAPAFVASSDSCVCSDDTKEPSEDGLSCVDKPLIPQSATPLQTPSSASNSPSVKNTPKSITSGVTRIGLNMLFMVIVLIIM